MNPEELRQNAILLLGLAPDADDAAILEALQPLIDLLTKAQEQEAEGAADSEAGLPEGEDILSPEDRALAAAMKAAINDRTPSNDYRAVLAILHSIKSALAPRQINLKAFSQIAQAQAHKLVSLPPVPAPPFIPAPAAKSASSSDRKPAALFGAPMVNRLERGEDLERTYPLASCARALANKTFGLGLGARAMDYSVGILGGYALKPAGNAEILAALRAQSVLPNLGLRRYPAADGQPVIISKFRGATTAFVVGANAEANEGTPRLDVVEIIPVKLSALAAVPETMLQSEVQIADLEAALRQDLVTSIELKRQELVLYGIGATASGQLGREFVGLKNTPGVVQTIVGDGVNGGEPTTDDVFRAVQRIRSANVRTLTVRSASSTRTNEYFARLDTLTGEPNKRIEVRENLDVRIGAVENWTTNIIPDTLTVGASTTCSDMFIGDWSYAAYAEGTGVSLRMYDDSNYGRRGMVGFQATTYFGFAVHYPEAFQVLTGILDS